MIENIPVLFLGILCFLMPLLIANRIGLIHYASPLHIVAFLAFFGTTLKVVIFTIDPTVGFFMGYLSDPEAYVNGLIYVFLFVLSLCIGYCVVGGRSAPHTSHFTIEDLSRLRFRSSLTLFAVASAIATTTMLLTQRGISGLSADALLVLNSQKSFAHNEAGIGSTGALVKTFYTIPRVLFVLLVMIAVTSGKKKDILNVFVVGMLLVGIAMISGDRFELLRLIGYAVIGGAFAGWRISLRSTLVVAVALSAVVSVSAIMSSLRQGEALVESDIGAFYSLSEQVVGSTYFMDVNVPTIIIDRMPSEDFFLGDSYLWWIYAWVPRSFWPNKPAVDLGVYLKREILGVDDGVGGAINVTGAGEAFINFGWLGALVGGVLGALFRTVEIFLLRPTHYGSWRFVYYPACLMLFIMGAIQSSFSGILVSMIPVSILTAIVIFLFLGPRSGSLARPGTKRSER